MLYTRKGDNGTTKTLHCDQRMTKGSLLADALGTVDELNAWLGIFKSKLHNSDLVWKQKKLSEIIEDVQQNLFIIQAELAGATGKKIKKITIQNMEHIIDDMEQQLPKISSFFVPGANELSAVCEYGRVVARRAEREVIKAIDGNQVHVSDHTKIYLNRLSSLLYVLVRFINYKLNTAEVTPHYQ